MNTSARCQTFLGDGSSLCIWILRQGSEQFAHVQRDQGAILVFLPLNCRAPLMGPRGRSPSNKTSGNMSKCWILKIHSAILKKLFGVDHVVSQVDRKNVFPALRPGMMEITKMHERLRANPLFSDPSSCHLVQFGGSGLATKVGTVRLSSKIGVPANSAFPEETSLLMEYRFRFLTILTSSSSVHS